MGRKRANLDLIQGVYEPELPSGLKADLHQPLRTKVSGRRDPSLLLQVKEKLPL